MTIRPPLGIYHHPWDGMQIYTPRCVLGETMLDAQALSYAVPELAKEVIYGTFADAPMPNVPCSREDGSMNMIGAGGAECGTAPTWGMPFTVIRALYLRDGDKEWLGSLYPYLQSFLEWWLENRTDADGWFHCNNSWESGQDGSKRFLVGEAQVADFVRTVDVEAVMASAMANMAWFAEELGLPADRWQTLAEERVERTRAMFVDGWFRDFDGRTGEPILLEDYWDIMMLVPLAVGIATPEQIEAVRPRFEYFRKNPSPFLEWPSFLFPATEAAWNAGLREWAAEVVADTGNRIYARTTRRAITKLDGTGLPEPYNYRIPGVQSEFWPIEPPADIGTGAECYGWGATLPTLVIRNIFGFREGANGDEFLLAPSLPAFATPGMSLGISNLRHRDLRFDLACTHSPEGSVNVRMTARCDRPVVVTICTGDKELASARLGEKPALIHFQCANSEILRVSLDSRTAEGKTGS